MRPYKKAHLEIIRNGIRALQHENNLGEEYLKQQNTVLRENMTHGMVAGDNVCA